MASDGCWLPSNVANGKVLIIMKIFTFPTGPFFGYQRGVIIDLLVYMPCFVVLSIGCLGSQLVLIVGFRALSSRRSTRLWCKSTCAQETDAQTWKIAKKFSVPNKGLEVKKGLQLFCPTRSEHTFFLTQEGLPQFFSISSPRLSSFPSPSYHLPASCEREK